ncbi:hypothetical protein WOSG25_013010 [Weissella oryzae SG25]|uniref:IpaB/EvcA family protein n=1 Tax=Weissella oryzae (strain DSM 25784 / JCM 18191 / LMG 30913 / SG25) TaxID=1329250 RepID=A0A069CS10_WEIOS|nr:hypothetical protein [Weissella oryzae]GAK30204.1 hypothetical protein WOSG25_013010 [Weissella oryzae SG25]
MTTFSADTVKLLEQVNQVYPGSIILRASGDASGLIQSEQVKTDMLGTRLMVEVTDATAPDFMATGELLQMLLTLNGYPQIFFQLSAAEEALTEQMMVMATYLYRPVMRAIIYREQAAHGLLTAEVANAYTAGVLATLSDEATNDKREAALRLLTLFDARVFMANYPGDTSKWTEQFTKHYPEAWEAAGLLVEQIVLDQIKDPASVHRAIVTAFKGFDAQMLMWELPELYNTEFTTVTPVLSERQLRLTVNQVFEIKHADFKNQATGGDAYIALAKNDGQNSFVITPSDTDQAAWFKEFYQTPVQDILDAMKLPYTLRD